jgi:hypothetical protein
MTPSIPAQSNTASDEAIRHSRLMAWVEAEDAAQGEVGCGHLSDRGTDDFRLDIILDTEQLRRVLQSHLGHLLGDLDFDSIVTQIQYQVGSWGTKLPLNQATVAEQIPTEALRAVFRSPAEFGTEADLKPFLQFCHQVIHLAVLRPRQTWASPIWVLKDERQIYITQAAGVEAAIAQVRTQQPQVGRLEVVTVGGLLAPEPVIALSLEGQP